MGGLIGSNGALLENCFSTSDVTNPGDKTGGLAGSNYGIIRNCVSSGNIIGANEYNVGEVGGLVGRNIDGAIDNSYSSSSVQGYENIGGLVGVNLQNSQISNSYNFGNISGVVNVGGVIGYNSSSNTINNCFNFGYVDGENNVGGLVGGNHGEVLNSFWDLETSGQEESDGGTGKLTIEMKDVATFTNLSTVGLETPWDFVNNPFDDIENEDVWDINPEVNEGYPFLTSLPVAGIDNEEMIENTTAKFLGNYPNPFNPSTTISYNISSETAENTQIKIYNIKGQIINSFTVIPSEVESSVIWNGTDSNGKPVSSGVYFYKLYVNGKTQDVKKCMLIK